MYCKECGSPLIEDETVCKICGAETETQTKKINDNKESEKASEKDTDHEQGVAFGSEKIYGTEKDSISDHNFEREINYSEKNRVDKTYANGKKSFGKPKEQEFTWNVYDFPKPRKTEDINFDWGETTGFTQKNVSEEDQFNQYDEAAASISPDFEYCAEKFFTFNRKNEEFQKLLDQEYERIRKMDPDILDNETIIHRMEGSSRLSKENSENRTEKKEINSDKEIFASIIQDITDNEDKLDAETIKSEDKPDEAVSLSADNNEESQAVSEMSLPASDSEVSQSGSEGSQSADDSKGSLSASDSEESVSANDINIGTKSPGDSNVGMKPDSDSAAEEQAENDKQEKSELVPLWFENNDDNDDKEEKKGCFGRAVLILIIIILLAEIASLGIRYFLPESEAASKLSEIQTAIEGVFYDIRDRITGLFDGNDEGIEDADGNNATDAEDPVNEPADSEEPDENNGEVPETPVNTSPSEDMDALIATLSDYNKNIKTVRANKELSFQSDKDYGVKDINNSVPIEKNIWRTEGKGDIVYYDREIAETLIAFDSKWIDYVNEGNKEVLNLTKKDSKAYKNAVSFTKVGKIKETFELLEIGELRRGKNGFYAWVYEEITIEAGGKTNKKEYHWIYCLEPVGDEMKIVNYYKY